jgi:hypothetical protein
MASDQRYRQQSARATGASSATDRRFLRSQLPRVRVSGVSWTFRSEESLSPKERPDPANRQTLQTAGSKLWLDLARRNTRFGSAAAVALTTDSAGSRLAERGLPHEVYRASVSADGSAMLFLSRDGILHVYTDRLEPVLTQAVAGL